MVKNSHIFLFAVLFLNAICFSQTYKIDVYAPNFKGKTMILTGKHPFSNQTKILDKQLVSKDGRGVLSVNDLAFVKLNVRIEQYKSTLYLDSKTSNYQVGFYKPKDKKRRLTDQYVPLTFYNLDTNDVNNLLLSYNKLLDEEITPYLMSLPLDLMMRKIKRFKTTLKSNYQNIKQPYFLMQVKYSIAQIEHALLGKVSSKKVWIYLYETYIKNKKILYDNEAYMRFFKSFFCSFLNQPNKWTKQLKYATFQYRRYDEVKRVMSQHPFFFKQDKIAELALMVWLKHMRKKAEFKEQSDDILRQIQKQTRFPKHRILLMNLNTQNLRLQKGDSPPKTKFCYDDKCIDLSDFKGKYVCLQFFTSNQPHCLKDIALIKQKIKSYKKDVVFVGISMDEHYGEYETFLTSHKLPWQTMYYDGDYDVVKAFEMGLLPHYVLIDKKGKLLLAHCPSPREVYPRKNLFSILDKLVSRKKRRRSFEQMFK